ncbi:DUF3592 domain-containing protein [Lentisphaera marina]|uniref:DUF3592 domain-containing protein n=1 Tax=Lentisphaera marina TaxID=1111041 RepID=UPI002366E5D5|nr:DUF3592 domain-containing protein [Lentisphaera marina]MDD7986313.1 DUF3592 domain-containing protein [Lentisphaera marina]
MSKSKSNIFGSIFLAIFGLPFFAAGIFVIGLALKPVYQNHQAKEWLETPATLTQLKLDGRGDSVKVVAEYRYVFKGKEYTGDTVGFNMTTGNVSKYHQNLYAKLNKALDEGRTVPSYVNPSNPQEAVLDRKNRTRMLLFMIPFGSVFALIGGGIMFAGLFSSKARKKEKLLEEQAPDEPWKWNKDWQDSVILAKTSTGVWGLFAVAVFVNLFMMPFWMGILNSDKKVPIFAYGIVGLFQLIAFGLIGTFIYHFIRSKKYGKVSFHMETFPGVIGGQCKGVIKVPVEVQTLDGFKLTLKNIHKYRTGSGKNSTTHRDVLWEDSKTIKAKHNSGSNFSTNIEVEFDIPSGGKISQSTGDSKYWELTAIAETPGVDFKEEFLVPVFVTEDSQNKPIEIFEEKKLAESNYDLEAALPTYKIYMQEMSKGLLITVPRMRRISTSLLTFIFTCGIGTGMGFAIYNKEYFVTFVVGIFFLITLAFFYSATFIKREFALKGENLIVKQTHPLGTKIVECQRDDAKFDISWSAKTNDKPTSWVLSLKSNGKKITLVSNCKDKELLIALKHKLLNHGKAPGTVDSSA